MAEPDIQYFAESGTWHKPAGAVRVDLLVKAGDGGGTVVGYNGPHVWGFTSTWPGGSGGSGVAEPSAVVGGGGSAGGFSWPKPAGATTAEVIPGPEGDAHVQSFSGDKIPETMQIEIGRGGRGAPGAPDGADGWALVVTHLA